MNRIKYMKRISLLAFVFFSLQVSLWAQDAAKAKALLDRVYEKVTGYDNIFVDFKFELYNAEANVKQETRGDLTLKGDKYFLNYMGAQQLYDGKKVFTIVPENEEVTVENKSDESGTVSPSKMLTFYREGHRYAWDISQTVQGRKIQFVRLTPIDSHSETASILLGVDAETLHITKLIETGKNGTKTTITVNQFKTNQTFSGGLFTFNEKKYKDLGYYIIKD